MPTAKYAYLRYVRVAKLSIETKRASMQPKA
jgi:hypothetical protein